MLKLVLVKAEEPEIKLPTSVGSLRKQESSRKTSNSALLTMPKPLTVWITTNCGKFLKRGECQTTWPASWVCRSGATVRTGHGTTNWLQIGKGSILSPCLFNLRGSLVAQLVKNHLARQETWVQFLGWEVPLEKGKTTHSGILTYRIPWTIQSMVSQRVGHNWAELNWTEYWRQKRLKFDT